MTSLSRLNSLPCSLYGWQRREDTKLASHPPVFGPERAKSCARTLLPLQSALPQFNICCLWTKSEQSEILLETVGSNDSGHIHELFKMCV